MRCRICAKVAGLATITVVAAACVAAGPAMAEPYNWAGFYFGGNVGGHESRDNDSAYMSANPAGFIPSAVAQINSVAPVILTPTGAAGGVQAGYNWQFSETVLGLEADIDALGGNATRNSNLGLILPPSANPISDSAQDRWLATLRARLGYTFGLRGLFYVTGGVALSNWSTNHMIAYGIGSPPPNPVVGTENNTTTRFGWTVGGGIEAPLGGSWIGRAEYLYANFGTATSYLNATLSTGAPAVTMTEPEKLSEQIFRVGVSYYFH
jgi:outer membrane immunogenic protein